MGNRIEIQSPRIIQRIDEGKVDSVNGQTGDVVLTADDINFKDGENFQQKFDSGELRGQDGAKGQPGKDGKPGKDGINGVDGKSGADGKDGFSPIAFVSETSEGATISIQDKTGTTTATVKNGEQGLPGTPGKDGVNGKDGTPGKDGKDAIINGVNTLTIAQGENITLAQEGETLTISASGGGGGSGWDLSDRITKCEGEGTVKIGQNTSLANMNGKNSLFIGNYLQNGDMRTKYSLVLGTDSGGYISSNSATWSLASIFAGQMFIEKPVWKSILVGEISQDFDYSSSFSQGVSAFGIGIKLGENSSYQLIHGKFNIKDDNDTYARIVGNGTDNSARDNAYTLDWLGNGSFKGKVSSQGADYAEYFEWLDGNPEAEDRVGYLVTLDGNKIRKANAGDDVLGIVSGTIGVLGDNYEWSWQGKYLTDDFGRILYDMVEEFSEDEDGTKHSLGFFPHPRLNPDYNPDEKYINRADRKEWDAVGMMGKLFVRDDGTATINSYIKVGEDGVATVSSEKSNMKVMERIKPNIIRVCFK